MLSIPTRTSVVLAALVVALASMSASRPRSRSARTTRTRNPPKGLTAAQRQEAAPLARLADEVMKGTAPGTYLVTAKDPASKDAKDTPSQPAPETDRADVASGLPEGPAGPDLRALLGARSNPAR